MRAFKIASFFEYSFGPIPHIFFWTIYDYILKSCVILFLTIQVNERFILTFKTLQELKKKCAWSLQDLL